jgi:hypothetical protein
VTSCHPCRLDCTSIRPARHVEGQTLCRNPVTLHDWISGQSDIRGTGGQINLEPLGNAERWRLERQSGFSKAPHNAPFFENWALSPRLDASVLGHLCPSTLAGLRSEALAVPLIDRQPHETHSRSRQRKRTVGLLCNNTTAQPLTLVPRGDRLPLGATCLKSNMLDALPRLPASARRIGGVTKVRMEPDS